MSAKNQLGRWGGSTGRREGRRPKKKKKSVSIGPLLLFWTESLLDGFVICVRVSVCACAYFPFLEKKKRKSHIERNERKRRRQQFLLFEKKKKHWKEKYLNIHEKETRVGFFHFSLIQRTKYFVVVFWSHFCRLNGLTRRLLSCVPLCLEQAEANAHSRSPPVLIDLDILIDSTWRVLVETI